MFLASDNSYRLLITSANRLDPDLAQQNDKILCFEIAKAFVKFLWYVVVAWSFTERSLDQSHNLVAFKYPLQKHIRNFAVHSCFCFEKMKNMI